MHSCRPASCSTPATLALITAVGPPDCPTRRFPTSSDIILIARYGQNLSDVHPRRPFQNWSEPCQSNRELSKRNSRKYGEKNIADGTAADSAAGFPYNEGGEIPHCVAQA